MNFPTHEPIDVVGRSADLPVTWNQAARLLSDEGARLNGSSPPPFHFIFEIRLAGRLNFSWIGLALNQLVLRHGALRTAFFRGSSAAPEVREQSVRNFIETGFLLPNVYTQSIMNVGGPPITQHNLDGLPALEILRRTKEIIRDEWIRNFDYHSPPMMRAAIVTIGTDEHLLLITTHHLLSDFRSAQIIRRDLRALYDAAAGKLDYHLPRLNIGYHDFAVWQTGLISQRKSISYWRRCWDFAESAPLTQHDLSFPTPASSELSDEPGVELLVLEPQLAASIKLFARRFRITLYMFILSALAIFFHRRTFRSLVPIWTSFANRTCADTQNVVGWFVNMHPITIDFPSNITVTQLLHRVKHIMLDGLRHQHIPGPLISHVLGRRHHTGELMIHFQVTKGSDVYLERDSGLHFGEVILPIVRSPGHQLSIVAHDKGRRITLFATYSRRRFEGTSMVKMLANIGDIAQEVIADPARQISTIAPAF